MIPASVRAAAPVSGTRTANIVEAVPKIPSDEPEQPLAEIVSTNLKRLRGRRGLSLERLARLSGVSRAMLGQVELGRSVPSINVVAKVAQALRVSVSSLLEAKSRSNRQVLRVEQAKRLVNADGSFVSRALFEVTTGSPRAANVQPPHAEFYEIGLAPGGLERVPGYPLGTQANLVVHSGCLELLVEADSYCLGPGDAIVFDADIDHSYENRGGLPCRFYLVLNRQSESTAAHGSL